MSGSFRSTVAYRHDICATVNDLIQRFTRPLPNGATVYVEATSAIYRLAKGLGSSFDSLVGRIIVPSDGTDNRWVQEEALGSSPWSATMAANQGNNIPAAGSQIWAPLGTNPGDFRLTYGDTDMWEVNATSSLLTYHGLPRFMLVTAIASVDTATANDFSIVVSKNDDVPAGSSTSQPLKGEMYAKTGVGGFTCISTQRAGIVSAGTTFRLMARSFPGDDVMAFNSFTLTASPL